MFADLALASLAKQCCAFLQKNQLIKTADEFLCTNPPNDADAYIISWIMNECKPFCYSWRFTSDSFKGVMKYSLMAPTSLQGLSTASTPMHRKWGPLWLMFSGVTLALEMRNGTRVKRQVVWKETPQFLFCLHHTWLACEIERCIFFFSCHFHCIWRFDLWLGSC